MGARLVFENDPAKPAPFELDPAHGLLIGRGGASSLRLTDKLVSREHARLDCQDGVWRITNLGQNGTYIDGHLLEDGTERLEPNTVLVFGDTTARFIADRTAELPTVPAPRLRVRDLPLDDVTAMCQFMVDAVDEDDEAALVGRALDTLLDQIQADHVGFLSLDAADPWPRMTRPDPSRIDLVISRTLTARVSREHKAVWLGRHSGPRFAGSLAQFTDALCAPVWLGSDAIGALHAYRDSRLFRERDLQFIEALASFLGPTLRTWQQRRRLHADNVRLRNRPSEASRIVYAAATPSMVRLDSLIAKHASKNTAALVRGESGVGKALVAEMLHARSKRASGPFVVVNCAVIPPDVMERELFGQVKGAFSGGVTNLSGAFAQADRGTLFLDEVTALPADCQSKLLHALEQKSFRPLGALTDLRVDVRVVASTVYDLKAEAAANRFRKELMYALTVVELEVPPLRERPNDVPELACYYLERLNTEYHKSVRLADGALQRLQQYHWPGNVRQLRATLEGAVVNSEHESKHIGATELPLPNDHEGDRYGLPFELEGLESWAISRAKAHTAGNKSYAAKLLGIGRDTLNNKIKLYKIDW